MKKTLLFGTSLALALATTGLNARVASVMTTEAFEFNTRIANDIVVAEKTLDTKALSGKALSEAPLIAEVAKTEAGQKALAGVFKVDVAKLSETLAAKKEADAASIHAIAVALAQNEELRKIVEAHRDEVVAALKAEKEAKKVKQKQAAVVEPNAEPQKAEVEGDDTSEPKAEDNPAETTGDDTSEPKAEDKPAETAGDDKPEPTADVEAELAPSVEGFAAQVADAAEAAKALEGLEGSEAVIEAPVVTEELTDEQRAAQVDDAAEAAKALEELEGL
jgi:hypothetical protein